MKETMLHFAASQNNTTVLEFLLNWKHIQIDKKIEICNARTFIELDLEAKNIDKDTPLHVAVKHGCFEAVQILLQHYAFIEAKNIDEETSLHIAVKNGYVDIVKLLLKKNASKDKKDKNNMTPLHLAVCKYNTMENKQAATIIKELLYQNANAFAIDNNFKTPFNHLSNDLKNKKIGNLLKKVMENEQMKQSKTMIEELEVALKPIIGMEQVKLQLQSWANGIIWDAKRRTNGQIVHTLRPPHMAFLGSPGTGKTMVARILAKLMHSIGILEKNKVVEVQRTDLVGQYIGHTGSKTREKINEARGGILFVDEAYRLMPTDDNACKDYGREALEEIMSSMEAGNVLVIFAGYQKSMERVLDANEGFRRRVTKFFTFNNFSIHELARMLEVQMEEQKPCSVLHGFKLSKEFTFQAIVELLECNTTKKQREMLNGGLVGILLVNAIENLNNRLDLNYKYMPNELVTITMADLEAGICHLPQI